MTGGADNRFLSRFLVVGFVALAFAGCAAMLGSGNQSLFSDLAYSSDAYAATGD